MSSFVSDLRTYTGRIRDFTREDWWVYGAWVGLMAGLFLATLSFVGFGMTHGAPLPIATWLLPSGAFIFTFAIAVDTIGHRTIYKEVLARAEGFVHHITIFCGVTSCVLLCLCYSHRIFFIPATVMTVLSFLYSLIDEGFHWHRYWSRNSDIVEMWSHLFILIGHGTMMLAWWWWCWRGYEGVAEVLAAMRV